VTNPLSSARRAVVWFKSSLSFANGNCVEVTDLGDGYVGVRNSRHVESQGAILVFTYDEWRDFITGARNGEFDLGENGFAQPPPPESGSGDAASPAS
jgi:hypothetical protein